MPETVQRSRPLGSQVVDLIPALRAFARIYREPISSPGAFHHHAQRFPDLVQAASTGLVNCAELPIPRPARQDWCVLTVELRSALDTMAPDHRQVLILVAGYGLSLRKPPTSATVQSAPSRAGSAERATSLPTG
jgi:RNA polymerase sigma-70 factor (ECF subfamily)